MDDSPGLVKTVDFQLDIQSSNESLLREATLEARSVYNEAIRLAKEDVSHRGIPDRVAEEASLVKNSTQRIVAKALNGMKSHEEQEGVGAPSHQKEGGFPLRANYGEGYDLTITGDGEISFRISAMPYKHVEGVIRGDDTHLEVLKAALTGEKWNIGTAEALFKRGTPELHVCVTQTDTSVRDTEQTRTIVGVDVNEDNVENISARSRFSITCVRNFHFNYRNTHFGRRGVRRALAYLISSNEYVNLLRSNSVSAQVTNWQHGMERTGGESFLGGDWIEENMIGYGPESKPEKAEEAMRKAGYERSGDTWVGPDGEATEGITIKGPSGIRWMELMAQYFSGALDDFGFENDLINLSYSNWSRDIRENQDFDATPMWQCGSYPSGLYVGRYAEMGDWDTILPEDLQKPSAEGCQMIEYEPPELTDDRTEIYGIPARPEIPDFGNKDGEPTQTLYPHVLKWELDQAQTDDLVTNHARMFAWYNNWDVPQIALGDSVNAIKANQRDFHWGETREPGYWSHRPTYHIAMGLVEGRN